MAKDWYKFGDNPYANEYGLYFFRDQDDVYVDGADGPIHPNIYYMSFYNLDLELIGLGLLAHNWGLYPIGRLEVDPPDAQLNLVDVPGSDVPIDLTESLVGRPLYTTREAEWEFKITQPRDLWDTIYSEMQNILHGRRFKVVRMEEPDWYYNGRLEVISTASDRHNGRVKLRGTFDPFKYSCLESDQDWLWDDFDFENGYINGVPNNYDMGWAVQHPECLGAITVTPGTDVVVTLGAVSQAVTYPTFTVVKAGNQTMTMTYTGATEPVTLPDGESTVPGLYFSRNEPIDCTFSLSAGEPGTVTIKFRGTSL